MTPSVEYNGFTIKLDGRFSMYDIHRIGAGKLPDSLQGSFTNTVNAKRAIDVYIGTKGKLKDADSDSGRGG